MSRPELKHALICPVCEKALRVDSKSLAKYHSLSCDNDHLFDFAKQGYLNLLLSQHKRSKHPGDTTEMVQARSQFLNAGFYQDFSSFLISDCLLPLVNGDHARFHFTDLACGEGYYTCNIHQSLKESFCSPEQIVTTGLDISQPAIKAACQRDKEIQWLIASLARTPLATHSQDLVTGLFFHFDFAEIERILKPSGHFVQVTTGPKHLIELREIVYPTLKVEAIKDYSDGPLSHLNTMQYKAKKHLGTKEDIRSLFSMTSHYWRSTEDNKQRLFSLDKLEITIDIQIDLFSNSKQDKQEKR